MKLVPASELRGCDLRLAALCRVDIDAIAECLGAKPKRGTFRDGLTFPNRYREICIHLSTGRYATLTQTEMHPDQIEIGLEIRDDEFFEEADLLELVRETQLPEEYVHRMRGGFTWVTAGVEPS